MVPDNCLDLRKSKTGAPRFGREEGIEGAPPHVVGHADPLVGDRNTSDAVAELLHDTQPPAFWHGVHRIENEIENSWCRRSRSPITHNGSPQATTSSVMPRSMNAGRATSAT